MKKVEIYNFIRSKNLQKEYDEQGDLLVYESDLPDLLESYYTFRLLKDESIFKDYELIDFARFIRNNYYCNTSHDLLLSYSPLKYPNASMGEIYLIWLNERTIKYNTNNEGEKK